MQTLESLRNSIASVEQMQSVVKTMKALAAISIRDYERAVESLSHYNETIELGLQIVLRGQPPVELVSPLAGQPVGVIVFGSEQGLAGQFNERIASYALEKLRDLDDDESQRRVLAAGRRVSGHLADGGVSVNEESRVPSSLEGILSAVQSLLLTIDSWRNEHGIERILLFHNTPISSASYQPRQRWLLPVSPHWLRSLQSREWDSRSLPIYRLPREELLSGLIRQFLFVTLYRAFVESLASENASRLQSMQSAERNIEDRLNSLRTQYQHHRQSSITAELLDIAAGFEALSDS